MTPVTPQIHDALAKADQRAGGRSGSKLHGSRLGAGRYLKTLIGLEFGNIVPGRVHSCSRQAFKIIFVDRLRFGRVDRMQRNFEPMRKQVEAWQRCELRDVTAKVATYEAFMEGKLEAPRKVARRVHDLYFEAKYEEFQSCTFWSLSNAFTSAFKEL